MNWTRRDWSLLVCLTLLAAGLRLYKLGVVPPGFQFDEAFNAIDARQVLHGNFPFFLPANAGREVLYTYLQAAIGLGFGLNVYTLRLASALAGIAAIPATYLLLRRILRQQSQQIATFTALVLAVSFWHIHFSHYGIRVILTPVLYSALFSAYWWATHAPHVRQRIGAFLLAGLLTGLAVWTHPTGRFVPLVLLAYTTWLLWRYPAQRLLTLDRPLGGLLITGGMALLLFLPLGLEFYRHPDWFTGHAAEVSVFAQRVSGDNPWRTLLNNLLAVLGMFTVHGDMEWAHNLAGRPVFDPLMSLAFLIGVGLWMMRLGRPQPDDPDVDALTLLAIWLAVMLTPSIFSEAAPNFSRTLPSLPATFVAAGMGLSWLAGGSPGKKNALHPLLAPPSLGERLVARGRAYFSFPNPWRLALAISIVAISGVIAFYDYFVRFPALPEVYYTYDADKLDALRYLDGLADQYEIYLQPLWADHPPVRFLRSSALVKALDTADAVVLPPVGKNALYAFPSERVEQATHLAQFWPTVKVEQVPDRYGKLMLAQVRLTAAQLTDWPPAARPTVSMTARFEDAPTLLGMQATPAGSDLRLFWRADQKTRRNLTTFVHLLDADGQRVGQTDKLPANGSYETPAWSPGERIIDRYYPEISDPCAGGESVQVVVGWYELAANGQRRPRLDAAGDSALAGHMTLPVVSYPPDRVALPNQANRALGKGLTLLAYAIRSADAQPGAPVVVDLYLQKNSDIAPFPLALRLINGQAPLTLGDATIDPQAQWAKDEILCRRVRTHLPVDMKPGPYQLALAQADTATPFADVTVGPSTRHFTAPPIATQINATLGDAIKLLGYNLPEPPVLDGQLRIMLVWQALAAPGQSYTVFLHLLNSSGAIVAQADALPASGYTTDRWISSEVITDTHTIALPTDLLAGTYQLQMGLYDPIGGQRLPALDRAGLRLADDAVKLGELPLP